MKPSEEVIRNVNWRLKMGWMILFPMSGWLAWCIFFTWLNRDDALGVYYFVLSLINLIMVSIVAREIQLLQLIRDELEKKLRE